MPQQTFSPARFCGKCPRASSPQTPWRSRPCGCGASKNTNRENALPEGETFVFSDTLGIINNRRGKAVLSNAGVGRAHFQRLLVLWARGRLPRGLRDTPFPFTSISVNKGYAAKLHRDSNNLGPSLALAVGNFTGGGLRYWPNDSKQGRVEQLRGQRRLVLNLKRDGPCVFDGTCGHEVQPFKGERYSLVFFTLSKYKTAIAAVRRAILQSGADWPSPERLRTLAERLPALPK